MSVRPETPRDGGAVHRVHVAAFGGTDEADFVDTLRATDAWIDGLSWVIEDNGLIIAHALISRVEIDEAPALSLAPVSVLPEHQRHGHGTTVIRAALDAAAGTGLPLVLVLGDPRLLQPLRLRTRRRLPPQRPLARRHRRVPGPAPALLQRRTAGQGHLPRPPQGDVTEYVRYAN
ncbi:N-acetyltransferase [Longispora sp. K20-0274]|uniref:GNAT family N-acetyltransferase n=1 Tax=Longispora sp. K20-0274 TaxID=3088255 RepID=UPI003999785C